MTTFDPGRELLPGVPAREREVVVFGVMGRLDDPESLAFLDANPAARILVSDPLIQVRGFGEVESDGQGLWWGRSFRADGSPRNWKEASEGFGSAGVFRDTSEWVVFTDSLGVNQVFYRRLGRATAFSTHLGPLIAVPGALTPDWDSWASTIVLCSPVGSSTHYREIRRMEAAGGLSVSSRGAPRHVSYLPTWATADPRQVTVSRIVEAIRDACPTLEEQHPPPAVTLSGGRDSRLLAALAVERYGESLTAWTIGQDDGRDLDLALAPTVASELGLEHRVLYQPTTDWGALATETRERVEYQTWLHTWYLPLADQMRGQVSGILDGLIGGRVLQDQLSKPEDFETNGWERSRNVFGRLGGTPTRFRPYVDGDIARMIAETARQSYLPLLSRFEGHRSRDTIASLLTRSARAIALAPWRVFGPEIKAWTPYVHPQVLKLALSMDPRDKLYGSAAHAALVLANPAVADLPSTSQAGPKPPRTLPRLQSSGETVQWMVDRILQSEAAMGLFEPWVLDEMRSGVFATKTPDFEATRVLQAASLLGQWESRYRDRLEWIPPPWAGV